ncbi:MAG: hypothetical protein IPJ39_10350 [Saprospiraceae bacterium]|nr:hypothetical protein [Saprospiraceae bacterium]
MNKKKVIDIVDFEKDFVQLLGIEDFILLVQRKCSIRLKTFIASNIDYVRIYNNYENIKEAYKV